MNKTIIIEGMKCGHCEKKVKKELETLVDVQSAEVDVDSGKAKIELNKETTEESLAAAVETAGYKFIEIL